MSNSMNPLQTVIRKVIVASAALGLLNGCATVTSPTETIVYGETVQADYTCSVEDGSILVTTREAVAKDKKGHFSHAFIPPNTYAPATITIGQQTPAQNKPEVRSVNDEIAAKLAEKLEGLTFNTPHHLTVTSDAIADIPKMERYLQYARTMRRPKQRSIPKTQFVANTGQEPVVGEVLFLGRTMPWKVLDVQTDSVTIEYQLKDGQKVKMPYGEAIVHDRGDHYILEIETRPGGLVRVGPYIGRIVDITDNLFIVDFEHPFGGRELTCEVTATKMEETVEEIMDSASSENMGDEKTQ